MPYGNDPHKVIVLDRTLINICVNSTILKKDPSQLFEPTQVQIAISPKTFTAQDAGIYSQKELIRF